MFAPSHPIPHLQPGGLDRWPAFHHNAFGPSNVPLMIFHVYRRFYPRCMSSMITIGADSTSPVTQAFLIDQAILADQNAVEGSFVPIRQFGKRACRFFLYAAWIETLRFVRYERHGPLQPQGNMAGNMFRYIKPRQRLIGKDSREPKKLT